MAATTTKLTMLRASIIIVNYNGKKLTVECLNALEKQTLTDYEVIIVDNASSDNSLEEIREFSLKRMTSHDPIVVPLARNAGFAAGNSEGLKHAKAEYIALLNNDTEPEKDWLDNLVGAMEGDPSIGICASKMIASGTGLIDSAGDGFSTLLKGFKRGEGGNPGKYDRREYIFGACAGAALYRRRMLDEIGFLDEDFFLMHEDTDLNARAQLAGWKVLYVPDAVVHHKVRSTIGHLSDIAVYYSLRNIEFVRIKNVPVTFFIKYFIPFVGGTLADFFYYAVKHGRLTLYLKAKLDVLRNVHLMLKKRKKVMALKRVSNKNIGNLMSPVCDREYLSSKAVKFFKG